MNSLFKRKKTKLYVLINANCSYIALNSLYSRKNYGTLKTSFNHHNPGYMLRLFISKAARKN